MNIDTDTQWASWDGVRTCEAENRDFLQGQIGNPTGEAAQTRSSTITRVWLRAESQSSMVTRLEKAFADLNAVDVL